jgi:uridylate kinase
MWLNDDSYPLPGAVEAAVRMIERPDLMRQVDGIYDSDPRRNPRATRLEHLTHEEAMKLRPEVMDVTAFSLCFENKLPIVVFDVRGKDSIERTVAGEATGTRVQS